MGIATRFCGDRNVHGAHHWHNGFVTLFCKGSNPPPPPPPRKKK